MRRTLPTRVLSAATAVIVMTGLVAAPTASAAPASATLNWNVTHQTMDGFGASQAADTYGKDLYDFPQRDKIMDLLFSPTKGIGLSILRAEVGNGLNMPTIRPNPHTWDYTPFEPELWVMREARARGVSSIMSTVWSPPAWMKTNNRIVRGGKLKPENYQEFADYLANYVEGYKKHHDVTIDAVSVANEPEYAAPWQSTLWSGNDFAKVLSSNIGPTFASRNIKAKVIVGEEGSWSDSRLGPVYANPQAMEAVSIIGSHYYRGKPTPFTRAQAAGKKVWLTETSDTLSGNTGFKDGVQWAKYVHDFVSKADVNAFIYWLGASYKTNNESLIRLKKDGSFDDAKRLYAFGNYSKFVRPGYQRISIDENPVGSLHLSAFKDPRTGEFSIVAVNTGDRNEVLDLKLNGVTANQLTPHITNDRYNLADAAPINAKNGAFTVSVSGYSVITFTGVSGSAPLPEPTWRLDDSLDNWNLIDSRTPNWMLEGNNPYGAFDDDSSRARRTKLGPESITYRLDGMQDFSASIYYHKLLQGLTVQVSSDKKTWQTLSTTHAPARLTGGFWEHIELRPAGPIPPGTSYIRFTFDLGWRDWDKHLGRVQIR